MQPPQIDYAPAPPGQKRHRLIRRVALGLAVLALVGIAVKIGPAAWRHVRVLYWQHRAMAYAPPADQVVYDDGPAEAPKLLMQAGTIAGANDSVFLSNEPWDRLYELISPPGGRPRPTLFLHERRNSKGERRLVVVQESWIGTSSNALFANANGTSRTADEPFAMRATVLAAGSIFRYPTELNGDQSVPAFMVPSYLFLQPTHFRWYAGQFDPKDASHFTIHGRMNGKSITVNGWLRDDDRVEFDVGE
jgi:hypothetical protein